MEEWRNEEVDFSWPDGFRDAAACLTMVPEEQREGILAALAGFLMFF